MLMISLFRIRRVAVCLMALAVIGFCCTGQALAEYKTATDDIGDQYSLYVPYEPIRPCVPVAPQSTLVVEKAGEGSGTVVNGAVSSILNGEREYWGDPTPTYSPVPEPKYLDCGLLCEAQLDSCTQVVLTAIPDADSVFEGWTQSFRPGENDLFYCRGESSAECRFEINGDGIVAPVFELKTYADLAVSNFTVSPRRAKPGDPVVFGVTLVNKGPGVNNPAALVVGISKTMTTRVVDPETGHTTTTTSTWSHSYDMFGTVPALQPGETWTWTNANSADKPILPEEGNYMVAATVKSKGEIINEDNYKQYGYIVDVTPPSAPQNFRVVATTRNSVTLAWDASHDDNYLNRVAYYIIRDGRIFAGTILTSFTDKGGNIGGLKPGQTYTYEIDAFDSSPNRNRTSLAERAKLTVTLPQ